jgi:carbonic anhydrase
MRNKEILKLILGFRRFKEKYFSQEVSIYEKLTSTGQSPKTLIIGCSDSRVDPAILSSASPGEIFVIRNVANLVPPFESTEGFHGVSAAIEFAVVNLKVENIVVLGHRQCGGIQALMSQKNENSSKFIDAWVKIALKAQQFVTKHYSHLSFEDQCHHCEMESIKVSLQNLKSFPFIQEAIQHRSLNMLGIYFDLQAGCLFEYDENQNNFVQIQV